MDKPTWVRSSLCSNTACVEVRDTGTVVFVRSSGLPDRAVMFTRAEWDAFIAGVRNGEFDFGGCE